MIGAGAATANMASRQPSTRATAAPSASTAGLASLPRKEIETFVLAGELLEIRCDFCGREFKINPESLRGLLETN